MAFQDKTLTCRDCGKGFTWSASEQEFYQSKGFQNEPVRCPDDRAAKKARMDGGRGPRQMHEITCSNCGKNDSVPFQPRGDRPVLCGDCFRKQRDGELDMNDKKHDDHEHSDKKDSKPESDPEPVEEEKKEEEKPQAE